MKRPYKLHTVDVQERDTRRQKSLRVVTRVIGGTGIIVQSVRDKKNNLPLIAADSIPTFIKIKMYLITYFSKGSEKFGY